LDPNGLECQITLRSKTIEIFHTHYERQQIDRLAAGVDWQEYGLIFTTGVGTPIHPRNLMRKVKQLLKDAGLPAIRFHDLRHTNASLPLNQGKTGYHSIQTLRPCQGVHHARRLRAPHFIDAERHRGFD